MPSCGVVFHLESKIITTMPEKLPRGLRNNNPLNIRRSPQNHWQGSRPTITDPAFEEFRNMIYGYRAAIKIIKNRMDRTKTKSLTPELIITSWAPPQENDTPSYIARACEIAYLRPNDRIKFSEKNKLCCLIRAMALIENGKQWDEKISMQDIETAYEYVKQNRPII